MRRTAAVLLGMALLAGCLADVRTDPQRSDNPDPTAPSGSAEPSPSAPGEEPIAECADLPVVAAPDDAYRAEPIYVANEMPADALREWARMKPAFEEIWIDRDHQGWITLAFSADAEARQAELAQEFPDVGVVAVAVDWKLRDLEALQGRVNEALRELAVSTYIDVQRGVVGIGLGVLEPERLALVADRFGGQRICVEGIPPELAPRPGPQQPRGEGWRLLADEPGAGGPYRTGIAADQAGYEELWRLIGLASDAPEVDFQSEVVIWFGAVHGSSCPNLRLDDVVTDDPRDIIYAIIVNVDQPYVCTADAVPRAYVVAVERSALPAGPFAIQLDEADPPVGAPEERTVVDANLSIPGSVPAPGAVHGDPTLGQPQPLESGAVIEPGYPDAYRFSTHCGIEWLGEVNGVHWRARDATLVPDAWQPMLDGERIVVELLLTTDPEPMLTATANGLSVTYLPSLEEPPGCD